MRARLVVAAAALATVLTACGSPQAPNAVATDQLEVLTWWTSGSESRAFAATAEAYRQKHPGVTLTDSTVAGGSGSNARVEIAKRLAAGDPPDVWQTFPGAALEAVVSRHQVADVSAAFEASALAPNLPPVVLDGLTFDGRQYGMPTSAHRQNVLLFNRAALAEAGVAVPAAGYTPQNFLTDLGKVRDSGGIGLCLGGADPFATATVVENQLLSVVGPQGWSDMLRDRFAWDGGQVGDALAQSREILAFADPEASGQSWDQATARLGEGRCAFEVMNDSAYGELITGRDPGGYGAVAYPGTEGSYLLVMDTFVQAAGTPNAVNATDFLTVVAQPETQLEFSRLKGSVPARTDVDPIRLSPYQQQAYASYRNDTLLWSITHGEAMNTRFTQGFYDGVAAYLSSGERKAFDAVIIDAIRAGGAPNK